MNVERLNQIIKDKNDQRERVAVHTAEEIIEAVVREQQTIVAAQARIQSLREELGKLQVEQLDPKTILGGD